MFCCHRRQFVQIIVRIVRQFFQLCYLSWCNRSFEMVDFVLCHQLAVLEFPQRSARMIATNLFLQFVVR